MESELELGLGLYCEDRGTNVVQLFSLIKSFNEMIVRYFVATIVGVIGSPFNAKVNLRVNFFSVIGNFSRVLRNAPRELGVATWDGM